MDGKQVKVASPSNWFWLPRQPNYILCSLCLTPCHSFSLIFSSGLSLSLLWFQSPTVLPSWTSITDSNCTFSTTHCTFLPGYGSQMQLIRCQTYLPSSTCLLSLLLYSPAQVTNPSWLSHFYSFFNNFSLCWSISCWQCWDSFRCTAKKLSHTYACSHFPPPRPSPIQADI